MFIYMNGAVGYFWFNFPKRGVGTTIPNKIQEILNDYIYSVALLCHFLSYFSAKWGWD